MYNKLILSTGGDLPKIDTNFEENECFVLKADLLCVHCENEMPSPYKRHLLNRKGILFNIELGGNLKVLSRFYVILSS